jgi:hypothetical protein
LRDAIVKKVKAIKDQGMRMYVRSCCLSSQQKSIFYNKLSPRSWLGRNVVAFSAKKLSNALKAGGIKSNRYLLGYYDYEGGENFADIFKFYINFNPSTEDMLFCHPGIDDSVLRSCDDLCASREDVRDFVNMVKPKNILPAHGSNEKKEAMMDLCKELGYKRGKSSHHMQDGKVLKL